jgi:hypothetical protein
LKRIRQAALLFGQAADDGERRAVAGALQELLVLVVEGPLLAGAHVQHAHHAALHQQRDAEHRVKPLLAQYRVHDVRFGQVQDADGASRRRDAAGEAASDRDAHAALDLLLEALGGASDQRRIVVFEQEDRGGVHAEDPDHALEELREQGLQRQIRQRGIGDALEITEPIGGDARFHGRDSASPYGWSRCRTASPQPTSAARRWNS